MRGSDPRLARVVLVLAIFAVYLPLVGGGFVWDDHLLVVENQLTGSLSNIPQMFLTDLWGATPVPEAEPGYYRPLMLVDLAVSRALFDLNHRLHHLHHRLHGRHRQSSTQGGGPIARCTARGTSSCTRERSTLS